MGESLKQHSAPTATPGDGNAAQASAIFGDADSAARAEAKRIVERYASAYVELGSWAAAYRRCYDCSTMKPATVWRNSYAMSQYPGVRERVRELYAQSTERTIVTIAEALRAQFDVAIADPNEIVRVSHHACRYCHGVDGAYQWRTQDEFAMACAAELDRAGKALDVPKLPSDAGGYGYTLHRPPNPECEQCGGAGEKRVHITDTNELSGPARRLYKGAKMDRHGVVTVELHDQQRAWDAVNRILGAYKDTTLLLNPSGSKTPETIAANVPKADVAAAYQRLIG